MNGGGSWTRLNYLELNKRFLYIPKDSILFCMQPLFPAESYGAIRPISPDGDDLLLGFTFISDRSLEVILINLSLT